MTRAAILELKSKDASIRYGGEDGDRTRHMGDRFGCIRSRLVVDSFLQGQSCNRLDMIDSLTLRTKKQSYLL